MSKTEGEPCGSPSVGGVRQSMARLGGRDASLRSASRRRADFARQQTRRAWSDLLGCPPHARAENGKGGCKHPAYQATGLVSRPESRVVGSPACGSASSCHEASRANTDARAVACACSVTNVVPSVGCVLATGLVGVAGVRAHVAGAELARRFTVAGVRHLGLSVTHPSSSVDERECRHRSSVGRAAVL